MDEKKEMIMKQEAVSAATGNAENTAPKAEEAVDGEDEDSLVIQLRKPYLFEKKEYTEIDLSGMEDLSAQDMIAVEKRYNRDNPGANMMPEITVGYAMLFAAQAAKLPVEFFMQLPPREAMRIKNRVMGFLFGAD